MRAISSQAAEPFYMQFELKVIKKIYFEIKLSQNYLQYIKLAQFVCLGRNPGYPRVPLATRRSIDCVWQRPS